MATYNCLYVTPTWSRQKVEGTHVSFFVAVAEAFPCKAMPGTRAWRSFQEPGTIMECEDRNPSTQQHMPRLCEVRNSSRNSTWVVEAEFPQCWSLLSRALISSLAIGTGQLSELPDLCHECFAHDGAFETFVGGIATEFDNFAMRRFKSGTPKLEPISISSSICLHLKSCNCGYSEDVLSIPHADIHRRTTKSTTGVDNFVRGKYKRIPIPL